MTNEVAQLVRTLYKSKRYALVCILLLALGIGANTAIFSAVYAVMLRPLPFPDSDRLVYVWEHFPGLASPLGPRMWVARRNYEQWRRRSTVFDGMAAYCSLPLNETGGDHPRPVSTGFASTGLFPLLGVKPTQGRLFSPADDRANSGYVAVITDRFFEQRFHRSDRALGTTLTLDGKAYTIIGVLPRRFRLPSTFEGLDELDADVWVPLRARWARAEDENLRTLYVVARLKQGVELERARAEMNGIAGQLAREQPELNQGWTSTLFPVAVENTAPKVHRALRVAGGGGTTGLDSLREP